MTVLWVVVDAAGAVLRSGTAPDKLAAIKLLAPTPTQYVTSLASYQAGQRERVPGFSAKQLARKEQNRLAGLKAAAATNAKRQTAGRREHVETGRQRDAIRQASIQRGIEQRAAKRQQRGEG